MSGQAAHFLRYAVDRGVDLAYAQDRFLRETQRIYGVLDAQLAGREFIVDEFSIADLACFPWTRVAKGHGINLADFPHVKAWSDRIRERPSAQVEVEDRRDEAAKNFAYTDEQWRHLFGTAAPGPGRGASS
jgi:GST-like protein